MSFSIRNVREISNDPLTKFVNQLAKKFIKAQFQSDTEKLENKEDVYSNSQLVETVVSFNNFVSTKFFDFTTQYYPPTEPDGDKLRLWFRGNATGAQIEDWSEFDHVIEPALFGEPVLVDGTPFDLGHKTGGTKSIALRLNRPTSDFENNEYVRITDSPDLQIAGISTGISYFVRLRVFALGQQGDRDRTIFQKIDDATPSNAVMLRVSESGTLKLILKRNGTEYKYNTDPGIIELDTVYDIWVTYAVSGNAIHIYVNNVDVPITTTTDTAVWQESTVNRGMFLGTRGWGSAGTGMVYGDYYDFRIYREKIISTSEVNHMWTNKWTIADIPFGHVMITNYWSVFIGADEGGGVIVTDSSYECDSFTIVSFTTNCPEAGGTGESYEAVSYSTDSWTAA